LSKRKNTKIDGATFSPQALGLPNTKNMNSQTNAINFHAKIEITLIASGNRKPHTKEHSSEMRTNTEMARAQIQLLKQ